MITVFLCDDNEISLTRYHKKLTSIVEKTEEQIKISHFSSGESLIAYLEENPNEADIIFLDLLMGNLNGVEIAKKLRELGCISEIVFLTSSEDFVYDSFEASPLHYILKGLPLEDENIEKIFLKALNIVKQKASDLFFIETPAQKKQLQTCYISYFEIHGGIAIVHYNNEIYEFYSSIESIADELKDKNFVRCHKSYIVNVKYIDRILKDELLLTTGCSVPLEASFTKKVKLLFSKSLSTLF